MVFQIARRLLGKILIDLRNTRDEAISVAELKSSQEPVSVAGKEDADFHLKSGVRNDDTRRNSFTSEKPTNQDDEDGKETKYRLDPK